MTTTARPRPWVAVTTAVLQLAALLPYAASGLVAPTYAVVVLLCLGGALSLLAWFVLQRRGVLALAVPLLTVAVWVAVLTVGDLALGWTA